MHRLILGSQSPRRREIIGYFGLPFEFANPDFVEESVPFNANPHEYVCQIAKGKSDSLAKRYPDAAILTADTLVFCHGKEYAKPVDRNHAHQMLSELSGQWHSVITGLSLKFHDQEFHKSEETRVLFNKLTPEQINIYHDKVDYRDKAGAYAIQCGGALIVKKIDGCYYNVVGLPLNAVRELFLNINIDLWEFIK